MDPSAFLRADLTDFAKTGVDERLHDRLGAVKGRPFSLKRDLLTMQGSQASPDCPGTTHKFPGIQDVLAGENTVFGRSLAGLQKIERQCGRTVQSCRKCPKAGPRQVCGHSLAVLSIAEVQDLADQIHALSKPLAGMDPQIEVRITVKTKTDGDLSQANGILERIKAGWKL